MEAEKQDSRHIRDLYDASIAYMDHWVGELLDELSSDGLGDTVVAFLSDHGEEFYDHGGLAHTGTLYEELVRVPMMLKVPGVPPRRERALVRNFDVGPTLLSLAGLAPLSGDIDAMDLAGLVRGERAGERPPVVATFPVIPPKAVHPYRPARRMIRDHRYKLIVDLAHPEKSALYDLRADPRETTNVYDDHPEVVARLRRAVQPVVRKLESEHEEALDLASAVRLDPEGLVSIVPAGGTNLRHLPEGMVVKGRKWAPAIDLPYVAPGPDGRLFARLELVFPVPARVLYRVQDDGRLLEERAVEGAWSADRRTVDFEIEDPELVGPLTVRFGHRPAKVGVSSVAVAQTKTGLEEAAPAAVAPGSLDDETIDQLRALGYVE